MLTLRAGVFVLFIVAVCVRVTCLSADILHHQKIVRTTLPKTGGLVTTLRPSTYSLPRTSRPPPEIIYVPNIIPSLVELDDNPIDDE